MLVKHGDLIGNQSWMRTTKVLTSVLLLAALPSCGRTAGNPWLSSPEAGVFTGVVTGIWHGCGLRNDGSVQCWGEKNAAGTPPPGPFVKLDACQNRTCGLAADGRVLCWGAGGTADVNGRLPDSDNEGPNLDLGENTFAPALGKYTALSTSDNLSCAIDAGGKLICWGFEGRFEVGMLDEKITSVALGGSHLCFSTDTGKAYCFGTFAPGCFSPPAGGFMQIEVGRLMACGIRKDGTAECWGFGDGPSYCGGPQVNVSSETYRDDYWIHTTYTADVYFDLSAASARELLKDGRWARLFGPMGAQRLEFVYWDKETKAFVTIRSARAKDDPAAFAQIQKLLSKKVWDRMYARGLRGIAMGTGVLPSVHEEVNEIGLRDAPPGRFSKLSMNPFGYQICGLNEGGEVVCWGHKSDLSQFPEGRFKDFALGGYCSCVVREDGRIACWGLSMNGACEPP